MYGASVKIFYIGFLSQNFFGATIYVGKSGIWKRALEAAELLCEPQTADHPHIPRSHQQSHLFLSNFWPMFGDFPVTHSISGRSAQPLQLRRKEKIVFSINRKWWIIELVWKHLVKWLVWQEKYQSRDCQYISNDWCKDSIEEKR